MLIVTLFAPHGQTVAPVDCGPVVRQWIAAGWSVEWHRDYYDGDIGGMVDRCYAVSKNPDDA